MRRLTRLVALAAVVLAADPAFAIWFQSFSIEWQTDAADAVVVASVTSTRALKPLNEFWDSQEVACKILESIKGKPDPVELSFRQDFPNPKQPREGRDPKIETGHRLLLFLGSKEAGGPLEVMNSINLTHPIQVPGTDEHGAYDNDCRILTDEESITRLVRERVALGSRFRRGLIVRFKVDGKHRHDFIITAEPNYKQALTEQLKSEVEDARESAVCNLISYPGEETERLLLGVMKGDPYVELCSEPTAREKVFRHPVRQTAWIALRLLGVEVKAPEPIREQDVSWHFETGFEGPLHTPRSPWKRLADIAEPPPEAPFEFLRGKAPVRESHSWRTFEYFFAFEADFDKCRGEVEKELTAKGFAVAKDDPKGFGRAWRSIEYRRREEFVILFQNMRYTVSEERGRSRVIGEDLQGWVSFQVNIARDLAR